MDQNDLRSLMTVLMFAIFVGIVWWAYGKAQKQRFEEAAALPFTEDDEPGRTAAPSGRTEKG